jgi:hypothetical protein
MKTNALFAILAVAAEARFEDVKSYETFDATSCVTGSAFAKADAVYPDSLTMKVPFHGEDLELNVSADRSIFADDWSLVDDSGKVLSTDKEAWMCHYTGSVTGKKGSTVTISVCNEGGISGLIETDDFHAEIQPVGPTRSVSSLGSHIIYDMEDLVLRDDIFYGEPSVVPAMGRDNSDSIDAPPVRNATAFVTDPACNAFSCDYVMSMVTASDSRRMGAFSSVNAEVINTQEIVQQMNRRYINTNWSQGRTSFLRIQIQTQRTNVNFGGSPINDLNNYLDRVATWKEQNYRTADNVQAFTSSNSGGAIGSAYLEQMCKHEGYNVYEGIDFGNKGMSSGITNMGFTTSNSARGIVFAHEAGHNFGMAHEDSSPLVMTSRLNERADSFSDRSVGEFIQYGYKACL